MRFAGVSNWLRSMNSGIIKLMNKTYLAVAILLMLTGCMGNSLGEVRATEPLQTGTFQKPYEQLAACAKQRIETDSWRFGQPIVQSTQDANRPLIRVYAIYSRSTLFEVTFQPIPSEMTLVEYRRGYDGHGSQDQTWAIIEQCAQPVPVQSPDAGRRP